MTLRVDVLAFLIVAGSSGCSGCQDSSNGTVDSLQEGDVPVDDVPLDGPPDSVDAPPVMIDPECAGTSPTCATTPTTFVSITSPSHYTNMVRLNDTLYVAVYDTAGDQLTGARIIAADLVSGVQTTLLAGATSYAIATARGWAYAFSGKDSNNTLWRFRPGVAPSPLVTGRPRVRAVTADDNYVYWAEDSNSKTFVLRREIGGGNVEQVMECATAWRLIVDDIYVYCAEFSSGTVDRALKAGTQLGYPIEGAGYPITDMIRCESDLFVTDADPNPELDKVPLPDGPGATFVALPDNLRLMGLTATANDLYVSTSASQVGIYRIDRTTAAYQLLVSGEFAEVSPVAWNGQLFYLANSVGVRRCSD